VQAHSGLTRFFFWRFRHFAQFFFKKKFQTKIFLENFFFKKMMTVYFKKKYQKNDDHVSQKQIPKKIMTVYVDAKNPGFSRFRAVFATKTCLIWARFLSFLVKHHHKFSAPPLNYIGSKVKKKQNREKK
jgi:hypothetical protein